MSAAAEAVHQGHPQEAAVQERLQADAAAGISRQAAVPNCPAGDHLRNLERETPSGTEARHKGEDSHFAKV